MQSFIRISALLIFTLTIMCFINCNSGIDKDKATQLISDFEKEISQNTASTEPQALLKSLCEKKNINYDEFSKMLTQDQDLNKKVQDLISKAKSIAADKANANNEKGQPSKDVANLFEEGFDHDTFIQDVTQVMMSLSKDKLKTVTKKIKKLQEKISKSSKSPKENMDTYKEMISTLKDSGANVTKLEKALVALKTGSKESPIVTPTGNKSSSRIDVSKYEDLNDELDAKLETLQEKVAKEKDSNKVKQASKLIAKSEDLTPDDFQGLESFAKELIPVLKDFNIDTKKLETLSK